MREFILKIIESGEYVVEELDLKIWKMYVVGLLTEDEATELQAMAAEKADNAKQVDLYAKVVDLEHRIEAIETADFAVWKAGYVTKKNEIVKIDLDGDGVLDYAMYAGGRSETALSVGKIDGWYKVTSTGEQTHTIKRNSDGTYTLTAIEAAS